MDDSYFSIGELAEAQNISRQTLIFYDRIDLFKPEIVDPNNGYRYYSPEQLDILDTILLLKKIGMSLKDIRRHLSGYDTEQSLETLKKSISRIDRKIRELRDMKARLNTMYDNVEGAIRRKPFEITYEISGPYYLLTEDVNPPYNLEEVSLATKKCMQKAKTRKISAHYQMGAILSEKMLMEGRFEDTAKAFIPAENPEVYEDMITLEKKKRLAIFHRGSYDSIRESYERLIDYCKKNSLRITSPSYEFALNDFLTTGNEKEYVTKILVEVETEG